MSNLNVIDDKNLPEELWNLKTKIGWTGNQANADKVVKKLINKEIDLSVLKKYNLSMAVNGTFYNNEKQDYTTEIRVIRNFISYVFCNPRLSACGQRLFLQAKNLI